MGSVDVFCFTFIFILIFSAGFFLIRLLSPGQQIVHEKSDSIHREKERRALELLQKPQAKYDIDHALILCQMNNFKVGILYLYEKAHLYQVWTGMVMWKYLKKTSWPLNIDVFNLNSEFQNL